MCMSVAQLQHELYAKWIFLPDVSRTRGIQNADAFNGKTQHAHAGKDTQIATVDIWKENLGTFLNYSQSKFIY